MQDAPDTAQAEGESPDGADKPPHEGNRPGRSLNAHTTRDSRSAVPSDIVKSLRDGVKHVISPNLSASPNSYPLPPPEAGAFPKEPGYTKGDLGQIILQQANQRYEGAMTPSPSGSPEDSDDEDDFIDSAPSTRPNSRAPSMSYGKSGSEADPRSRKFSFSSQKSVEKKDRKDAKTDLSKASRAASSSTPTAGNNKSSSQPPSRPPSVLSNDGDRHKFSLEKLLNSTTTKLQRNLSARSTASSKKSDSDADKRSTAGDSSTSLSKKYGVYDRGPIGKGATSVVRLAHKWDRTEEKVYAVKEFRKKRKNETEKEYVKKLTAEFCISSTLHHVNIVETVDLIQDENKHWCEVMEFCPGGDLYAAIRKGGMSPSEVECCFKQMLTGVAYLHSQGVAHRDIKPENLFFNSRGQLKIGDYGASTVYRLPWESTVHMSSGLCGSEPYIAPEQFSCKQYDARLVDIWACGIVYYCLHFQELPWRVAQTSDPLYAAYVSACASSNTAQSSCPPTINNLSPRACRPLIRKMLEPDPKLRWTIEEAIKFPWVESIEVCHAVSKPSHVHVYARALAREAGLQEDHM